jgi:hypothetical protein
MGAHFFLLGRIMGIEPMHGRFTAGCVKPLHHIRQRVIVYSTPRQSASGFTPPEPLGEELASKKEVPAL